MAQSTYDSSLNPEIYLSPQEQELLLTALESNKPGEAMQKPATVQPSNLATSAAPDSFALAGASAIDDSSFFTNPLEDYDFDTSNINWDYSADSVPQVTGDDQSPTGENENAGDEYDDEEVGEKRKSHEDADTKDENGKRRDEKTNKKPGQKPGRKPLTSEPTSKRKAQNRAAQRAFRERKEKHLKDLETKVEELEKASESANHENGILRAQVERLQSELKDYRKRLSTHSSPNTSPFGVSQKAAWDFNNNFHFAFPKFGAGALESTNTRQQNYSNVSPRGSMGQNFSASLNNPSDAGFEDFNPLFPTTSLSSYGTRSTPGGHWSPPQTNPAIQASPAGSGNTSAARESSTKAEIAQSTTDSESPASSGALGFMSSSATTPEWTADTPDNRKASTGTAGDKKRSSSINNQNDFSSVTSNVQPKTPAQDHTNFDWFATQNGGVFDPVLFEDYRDPQESVMNNDLGHFFNDALPLVDYTNPNPSVLEGSHKKRDLMQEIEDQQAGNGQEVVPGDNPKQFLTCNMLWDRVQRSKRVQTGEADMDDLCSQLKAKAKCSGNGAVIEQKDVDAILGPAPEDTRDFFKMFK